MLMKTVQGFKVAVGTIKNHIISETINNRVEGHQIHYEYFSMKNGQQFDNKRPLFVFVHGGAWKTGNSRMHYQKPFVELLLQSDVDVISCNYRKTQWPHPLQDVLATFEHIMQSHCDRPITFCGASAGGHLTILAYYYSAFFRKQQELQGVRPDHKMLLFYPAIDVFNQLAVTQPLLFRSDPPKTLLNTFFETFVVPREGVRHPDFPWVSPIELLESAPLATWSAWPSTYVVHGKQDAITLFQASEYFVGGLRFFSGDDNKHTLLGVEGSHNFDIPDCPQTKRVYRGLVDWILE